MAAVGVEVHGVLVCLTHVDLASYFGTGLTVASRGLVWSQVATKSNGYHPHCCCHRGAYCHDCSSSHSGCCEAVVRSRGESHGARRRILRYIGSS